MRYNEYLASGWPIASGPVEGACKNLIKDRMERSGMRWTEQMAEAIVQLRAIYLSGDFDRYWQFHIDQDQRAYTPSCGPSFQSSHTQVISDQLGHTSISFTLEPYSHVCQSRAHADGISTGRVDACPLCSG